MAKGHITSSQMGFGVSGVGASGALIVGLVVRSSKLAGNIWFIASVVVFCVGLLWLGATGAHALYVARKKRTVPVVEPSRGGVFAKELINKETGQIIGLDVTTDRTENSGIIAKEFPPPPLPVLDLTDSHDITFSGITFEAKGTVLKTDNSYNISMQDVQINQRDEREGETPITS